MAIRVVDVKFIESHSVYSALFKVVVKVIKDNDNFNFRKKGFKRFEVV